MYEITFKSLSTHVNRGIAEVRLDHRRFVPGLERVDAREQVRVALLVLARATTEARHRSASFSLDSARRLCT